VLFHAFCAASDSISRSLRTEERVVLTARLLADSAGQGELETVARWLGHGAFPIAGRRIVAGGTIERRVYAALSGETISEPGTLDHAMFEASRSMAGGTLEAIRLLLQAHSGDEQVMPSGSTIADIHRFTQELSYTRSANTRSAMLLDAWRAMSSVEVYWLHHLLSRAERHRPVPIPELEQAIAMMAQTPLETVRYAMMLRGDSGEVAVAALLGQLEEARLKPLQPLGLMLAERMTDDFDGALRGLGPSIIDWVVEPMLPGVRVQVHCWGSSDSQVAVFTRSSKEVADWFPELNSHIAALPDGTILDCQLIAVAEDGSVRDAESLGRRIGPPHKAGAGERALLVAIDVMAYLGVPQVVEPLERRRELLEKVAGQAGIATVRRRAAASPEHVTRIATDFVAAGAAGIILKRVGSPYAFGRRDAAWQKLRLESRSVRAVVRYATVDASGEEPQLLELTLGLWRSQNAERQMVNICRAVPDPALEGLFDRIAAARTQRFGRTWELAPAIVCDVRFDGLRLNPRTAAGCTLVAAAITAVRAPGTSLSLVGDLADLIAEAPPARAGGIWDLIVPAQ
jgi:DNA ligase-1